MPQILIMFSHSLAYVTLLLKPPALLPSKVLFHFLHLYPQQLNFLFPTIYPGMTLEPVEVNP
jgi:hypothetical protein